MSQNGEHSEDDIALAGEYALHLMEAAERRAFEARLAQEPALRTLVRDWDERLSPMADDMPPVPPPADMKHRIEQELFPEPAPEKQSFWTWLTPIRTGFAALALTVVIAGGLYLAQPAPDTHLARVAAQDSSLIVSARYQAETRTLALERVKGNARPSRTLELWLIKAGAAQPVSLGVLTAEETSRFTLPEQLASGFAQAVLAISDEPAGGSPTGLPTGAVLATGKITKL
mgnify:CR=1 FL=1